MSEHAVITHGLTRDYGNGAGVFDIDLSVGQGIVYGLVGLNGAGKTTLLMLLAGLRHPDSGQISARPAPSEIAICPDVPEFEPWLSAAEVVEWAARLAGHDHEPGRARHVLEQVGLGAVAHRRTKGFSRGMSQRLGLAAALIGRPRLLILDEPAAGLDPQGRADVLTLIESLAGQTTVIFSSHQLGDIERVCDEVGVLRDGRLVHQGPVRQLLTERLSPAWHVGVRGTAHDIADLLAAQPWVTTSRAVNHDTVHVEAGSIASGERGIPAVLSAAGHAITGMYPQEARLEDAFAALTSEGTR
ncbi:ABC transporter ATP-binding protein [Nonomuraea sp. NPDC050547]|uniref:ABC transporter ATP-binding protein n=1 Tax=Nonomuraea sp. NPDC050547 TaxID=3364368 RepID=UPI0037B30580